jgi:hypothetical protein
MGVINRLFHSVNICLYADQYGCGGWIGDVYHLYGAVCQSYQKHHIMT